MQHLDYKLLILSVVLFVCGLSSCNNKPEDEPNNPNEETVFIPNDASISYFANGANVTFEQAVLSIGFYSNKKWSASIAYTSDSKDWISLSENSGKAGDNSISLYISENIETENRTAVVTINVGGNNEYLYIEQTSCTNGDIDVKTPGTLSDFLPIESRPFITELKVKGEINGTDIKLIRSLFRNNGNPQLQKLDLSEATIVSGGDKYVDNQDAVADCHTSDYSVSPFMFMDFQGTELIIPQNTKTIGLMSFFALPNVEELLIPEGVELIDWQVFVNCSSLKQLVIPANVNPINDVMGFWISSCDKLESLKILSSVTLHDGITEIGTMNFQDCPLLKNIIIPKTVTRIAANAFISYDQSTQKLYTSLTEMHYLGTTSPWASKPMGLETCTLYVPKASVANFSSLASAFKQIIGE